MKGQGHCWRTVLASVSILSSAGAARGQEAGGQPVGVNVAEMAFVPLPGMPTCASAAVRSGDPSKGASILMAKMAAGCTFPWHWHTPNEHLMIVTGVGRMEMKDGKPVTLRPGGYAMMPSRHVHQFACTEACSLYVYSDTTFDMHYVDAQGKEISPDEAMKPVKQTAVKPPQ